ncbi:MAG: hypothetical protein M1834_005547 [Cirrosporium novae-zelandiae]|nr:MAG: hypothetical protein M1834_005547 [Cirrosporium novae-zelandiae]
MADVDITPHFGAELRDGFKPVNAWVVNGIAWLEDVEQFYRERSAIEKEYSGKLSGLAKKYYEKKAKKSSGLSVGDTPTVTPGSLESASMTTWTTQLSTLESIAAEHDRYASDLISQVAAPIKQIAGKFEDLRKSHADFAGKLEKERDSSYGDLKKMKGKYDTVCQEVENKRKKIESSFDSSKGKAQYSYQQQIQEMHNVKNTYLISISVTNKLKEKYYYDYVPELLDNLQDLSETRVAKLNSFWMLASQLESQTLSRSKDHVDHLTSEIPRNEPHLDSMMFARHNTSNWQDPIDFVFEPSPVWHDDPAMAIDDIAKVFLRNMLLKSKGQLGELKLESDKKRREIEGAKKVRNGIQEGRDKRDEVEVVRTIFTMKEDLHQIDRNLLTAEVEKSTIISAAGDISLGARNHGFKHQTFKIPTNCDLCGERIWGLSAKGFDCRDCGYTCHSKCEMKVPADCPGEQSKEEKKKLKAERQEAANASHRRQSISVSPSSTDLPSVSRSNTMTSLSSGYAASAQRSLSGTLARTPSEEKIEENNPPKPIASKASTVRRNRVVAPPPAQYIGSSGADGAGNTGPPVPPKPNEQRGKMLYAYQATGEGEISATEGHEIVMVEPDGRIIYDFFAHLLMDFIDGSGWMHIRCGSEDGLVPAAYVELHTVTTPSSDRPMSTYSNSSTSITGSVTNAGKKKGPAVAPKRGARKLKYAKALYDYEARTELEWSMREGDRFVLVNKNAGDGWAEVEKGGQRKSVPANYIEEI